MADIHIEVDKRLLVLPAAAVSGLGAGRRHRAFGRIGAMAAAARQPYSIDKIPWAVKGIIDEKLTRPDVLSRRKTRNSPVKHVSICRYFPRKNGPGNFIKNGVLFVRNSSAEEERPPVFTLR